MRRALTAAPIPLAAGFMVVVFVGSMVAGIGAPVPDLLQRVGQSARVHRRLRAGRRRARRTRHQRRLPDAAARQLRSAGPARRRRAGGLHPNGVPEKIVAETIRMNLPMPGTDYDWDAAHQAPRRPASTARRCRCRTALTPRGFRWRARTSRVPQQQSTVGLGVVSTAATGRRASSVVITAAGHHHRRQRVQRATPTVRRSNWSTRRPGPDGARFPRGRLVPYDLGPIPSWRNLRFPRAQIPADAVAVRVVAEDLSLTRRLDRRHATAGARTAVGAGVCRLGSARADGLGCGPCVPCQQPMLHANGVTEVPKFRITPDYNAKRRTPTPGRTGLNGGLLGITDLLLRAHVMATYLSQRLGSRLGLAAQVRHHRRCPTRRTFDFGTATHSGLYSPGKIRIGP